MALITIDEAKQRVAEPKYSRLAVSNKSLDAVLADLRRTGEEIVGKAMADEAGIEELERWDGQS